MPEIKRLFSASRMNRDLDDRLVKPGEYREALNINVSKSEGSDMGAIENVLGNKLVVNNQTANSKTIGVYRDNGNEKIYYFVTNNNSYDLTNDPTTVKHQIIEYNQKSNKSIVLVDNKSLNFHQKFLINDINLVDELLFFTDDRNPPRKINVETARNNLTRYNDATLPLIDNVISVAKYAPYSSADIVGVSNLDETGSVIDSNFIENKLIRFSYRYQFEDGEYSVLAPFTPTCFSRLNNIDTINTSSISDFGEIETFINAIKSVQLSVPIPTGYGITSVELIYKETGSSTLYVVEDKAITTETSVNFFYKSQDPFKTLPGDQLTRVSDAVPIKAKTQELAGGRLVYGNYLQNFDIPQVSFTVQSTSDADAKYSSLDENMSVKSRRTYQVGVVLADKFGRQTPVILSENGGDTIFVSAKTGEASAAFQALRIQFDQTTIDRLQALDWCYSYRIVVKQREQEYFNWISVVTAGGQIARLGDSINKIPRDQTAVIPPSTSSTISPCDTAVFPKILNGANQITSSLTKVQSINNPSGTANVPTITDAGASITSGVSVYETEPVESDLDIFFETSTGGLISALTSTAIDIQFYNCVLLTFTSGTHIEVNRLRAGFNEKAFDVGVRAYVVKENFAQERRFNTLIHSSGLFNSRTNINYINQFNEAEGGLTISLDPQDGSVQKLFADDTQIVVLQEDKASRSPINKDFIYSAEGGAVPVTSNTQFLGTIAPYAGEFGISSNPASFAYYGYARYFTDKNRGSVLRLSQNGLVEISSNGMGDFYRDALKKADEVIGSYDEYHNLYNLTLIGKGFSGFADTNVGTASDGYLTISFDESAQGWTSFKSFQQEKGISLNNIYYTFKDGKLWKHNDPSVNYNSFYGAASADSYVEPILNDSPSLVKTFNNISYEGTSGWELDFLQTDLSTIGNTPTLDNFNLITLQFAGSANNIVIEGEQSVYAKVNDVVEWIVTASPKNSDYQFDQITDVTLTGDSSLTITNPTAVTDGNLVFKIQYTSVGADAIKEVTIGGTGADLIFTVSLLTVSIGDSVANATLAPALVTYTLANATAQLNTTITAVGNNYVDPVNITSNVSALTALRSAAGSHGDTNKYVKVLNNGSANKFYLTSNDLDELYREAPSIVLVKNANNIFLQGDSTNTGHLLKFSQTSGGSEYTTGVTYIGTPGTAGAYTQITTDSNTPTTLYYYCDAHGAGMGNSAKLKEFKPTTYPNHVILNYPVEVTSTITNNNLVISGNVSAENNLTWAAVSSGTLVLPAGINPGVAYKISPYDADGLKRATLTFIATGPTKVLLPTSKTVTYNVANTTITSTLDAAQENLVFTITLPTIESTTTATATIGGAGEVNAAMAASMPTTHTFNASGSNPNLVIGDVAGEKANVPVTVESDQSWLTINGNSQTKTIDPDGIDQGNLNYPFNINVSANNSGSLRTGTITIKNANSRVTGLSDQTIGITQS